MTTNSTYQLYEPRRTEHALCADFPADEVLIRGLHTLEKYWWNKGWQSSLSAVRVINAVHYVATYMFNMPTRTQSEYDQMLYDYVGQDRMLMRAAMLALPEMLRRIALPQARSYRALMMEDRPEEFYEGVSLYEQWLEGTELYYREEDFLIDIMDEVNILRMKYNNALNEIAKMEKEKNEQKPTNVYNYNGPYIAEQHNDIHDNNNCNIYACPPQDGKPVEQIPKTNTNPNVAVSGPSEDEFKFIHPEVDDDDKRATIDRTLRRAVKSFPMREICALLYNMKADKSILLPADNPVAIYNELIRIGMPGEDAKGFGFSNFKKYYGEKPKV